MAMEISLSYELRRSYFDKQNKEVKEFECEHKNYDSLVFFTWELEEIAYKHFIS